MSWRYFKNSKQKISDLDAYDIIHRPVISEKSTSLVSNNQYVFIVAKDADKHSIAQAVQKLFKVDVIKVTTSNVSGKIRRFRGIKGRLCDKKRAIVSLKVGQSIETS